MEVIKTLKLMNKDGNVYEKKADSEIVKEWIESGNWKVLEERFYEVKNHESAHALIQKELHLFRQRMNKQVSYIILGEVRIEEIYSYLRVKKPQDGFESLLCSGFKVLLNKEDPMFVGVC